MNNTMINTPDGVYGAKLHAALWQLQYDQGISPGLVRLLLFILKIDLVKLNGDSLREVLKDHLAEIDALDIISLTSNKELIARCLEVKILLNRKHIKTSLLIASTAYRDVFETTGHYEYLVRHLGLIRLAKDIFLGRLPDIFDWVKNIVTDLPYPYWQFQVLKQLPGIYGDRPCQEAFGLPINKQLSSLAKIRDYTGAGCCLECLETIGLLNKNQRLIAHAGLLEQEAGEYVSEKKPNTFYPRISQIYSEALRLILELPDCTELKNRLKLKLQDAQLEDARMMRSVSSEHPSTINIESIHQTIVKLDHRNFNEAFVSLLSLPFIPADLISEAAEQQEKEESFIAKLFSGHVQLSALGKPIGFKEGKDGKMNQLRLHQREVLLVMIKMIKDIIDIYSDLLPEAIFEMLKHINSPFIPPARLRLFTDGLHAGFQNDFITASHLLVPQIEYSLRHIAGLTGISVTNYDKKEEFENTFGGTLEKISAITNKDLLAELKSFFVDSSNVNFRNELLHGNMSPLLIQHYGFYTWWLALKLIYQTNKFFEL